MAHYRVKDYGFTPPVFFGQLSFLLSDKSDHQAAVGYSSRCVNGTGVHLDHKCFVVKKKEVFCEQLF